MRTEQGWNLFGLITGVSLLAATQLMGQANPPPGPPPLPQVPRRQIPTPPNPRPPGFTVQSPLAIPPSSQPAVTPPLAAPPILNPLAQRPPVTYTQPTPTTPPNAIVYDAEFKEVTSKPGDTNIQITFFLTNTATVEVTVNAVRPSCGCTVAKLPSQPWHIPPGGSGPIEATLDLRGKSGILTKSLTVDSSSGIKSLLFKVNVADSHNLAAGTPMADPDRLKNTQMAMADRQVVFKNAECAKCHADTAHGKMGAQLFFASCGICHDTIHRATMVPDLRALKHPTNPDFWRTWITYGRAGSLMPAFAQSQGGPLSDAQIESLVSYLSQTIPSTPLPKSAAVSAPFSVTAPLNSALTPVAK